ncbi:MAG: hypothetical protein IKQ80_01540, partial [Clostridia bacterium]|nr:hypothetical protein [Clostridia bacterium]
RGVRRLEEKCAMMIAGSTFGANTYRTGLRFRGEVLLDGCPRNDILLRGDPALAAAVRDAGTIGRSDLQAAFYKTVAGADRPITATAGERGVIATHEAGHALASHLLMPENRLARVSILPSGRGAAGYNLSIPAERVMVDKNQLENQICVLLAGRAAGQLAFGYGALTAGASSDLARATELASLMVNELGMAGEPAVSLKVLARGCGGVSGAAEACKALLAQQYARVTGLLGEQSEALRALSAALMEAESLEGGRAVEIIDAHLSNERQKPA